MNSLVFHLKEPAYLIGLSLVPLLWLFFMGSLAWTRSKLKKFGEKELISRITPENSQNRQIFKFIILILAYICIIIHISGPIISFRKTIQNPADIFFLIDVSNSMLAEDIHPNRLDFAKGFIEHHPELWENSRIGLIPFAGQSFISVPLTRNLRIFKEKLSSLNPGSIPVQGTLISEALQLAAGSFSGRKDRSKIIILFTDGEDHEDKALELASNLKNSNIQLLVLGIGSPEGSRIPIKKSGRTEFLKDREGNLVNSKMNPHVLEDLALNGHGKFITLREDGSETKNIIASYLSQFRTGYQDQIQNLDFPSFLILALVFLWVEFLVFERKNTFIQKFMPKIKWGLFLLVFWFFPNSSKAQTLDLWKANQFYEQKHWKESEEIYRNQLDTVQNFRNSQIAFNLASTYIQLKEYDLALPLLESLTQSTHLPSSLKSKVYYNLGNLKFYQGNLEEARDLYIQAIRLNREDSDILYNLAWVRWKLSHRPKASPPPPMEQVQSEANSKKVPDPEKAPKQRKPVAPHLQNGGSSSQNRQNLEKNW